MSIAVIGTGVTVLRSGDGQDGRTKFWRLSGVIAEVKTDVHGLSVRLEGSSQWDLADRVVLS